MRSTVLTFIPVFYEQMRVFELGQQFPKNFTDKLYTHAGFVVTNLQQNFIFFRSYEYVCHLR